ncbi:hypothetical protein BC826DRAFT_365427 [Russula brevipes]|nr:hypothetical protein BC826DRAFT_365427 [Russula brevipes]
MLAPYVALRMHMNRLSNLSRRCRTLLSTLREYSPRLVEILVGTGEADEIEGAIERVLRRISGWEKLSDRATFLRQNEVQTGIGECYREFTTRTDGLTVRQPYVAHNWPNYERK